MLVRLPSILAIIVLPLFCICQGGFSRTWDFGNLETQVTSCDNGYLIISLSPPPLNGMALWKTDSNGNLLDTSIYRYSHPISLSGRALIKVGANNYIQSHSEAYQVDSSATRIVKFNKGLDTIASKMLFLDSAGSYDIWALANGWNDNEIVGVGFHFKSAINEYRLFWIILDTNLNVLDYRQMDEGIWGQYIQRCSNREYIVSGRSSFGKAKLEAFVTRTDSIGNELWRNDFTSQHGVAAASLFTNDSIGRFALMPEKMDANGSRFRIRFVKFNTAGSIAKDTVLPYDFYHLQPILNYLKADGTFVSTGYSFHKGGFKHYIFNFRENGDSLSLSRHYVGDDWDDSYTFSGFIDQDSNVVFGGLYNDSYKPPQGNRLHNWLLKTDKHGCVVSGCQNIGVEEFSEEAETSIALYPNPFRQAITLTWNPKEELLRKPTRAELRDATGRLVFSEKVENFQAGTHIFHLGKLPSGLYHFSLKQRGREIWVKKVIKN